MANSRPERFINRLIAEGISVHNISRTGKYAAVMTVRHSDLARVLDLAAENDCETELLHRGGIQLAARFVRVRLALVLSMLLACAGLYAGSKRLLAVRIEGADANLSAELAEAAAQLGAKRGCPLSSIDTSLLSVRLRSVDPRISFVSAYVNGAVLNIGVSLDGEERPGQGELPCSIYADKDCVLLRIAAFDGKLMAEAGEAVKAGQLLVDGDVTPEGAAERVLVHSSAEIIGEAAYRFSVTVEPVSQMPARSGNSVGFTRLSLFGAQVDSDTGFERYDTESAYGSWLNGFLLPIRVTGGVAWEIAVVTAERSRDDMIAEALERADKMLVSAVPKQARLISKTTELVWNDDGSLTLVVNVHTIENIGYSRYL